jgi:hypothetical protein
MSSSAEQLNAKLAALAKVREQKEECCKQLEAELEREAEQERHEEEHLQEELKRIEAEVKKQEEEERERGKVEEGQKKKEEAKVKKRAEAEKRAEVEKAKKRGRDELGTRLFENRVLWYLQEGAVCEPCKKSRENCLWRDSMWAKACRVCHNIKKVCPVPETRRPGVELTAKGGLEPGPEAGPSKKRKVGASKGKGKEKEASESEVRADASAALLAEMRGLREDFRALGDVG